MTFLFFLQAIPCFILSHFENNPWGPAKALTGGTASGMRVRRELRSFPEPGVSIHTFLKLTVLRTCLSFFLISPSQSFLLLFVEENLISYSSWISLENAGPGGVKNVLWLKESLCILKAYDCGYEIRLCICIWEPAGDRMAHFTEGTELSLLETSLQRCGRGDVTPNWGQKWVGVKGGNSHQFLESDFISGESWPCSSCALWWKTELTCILEGRKPGE